MQWNLFESLNFSIGDWLYLVLFFELIFLLIAFIGLPKKRLRSIKILTFTLGLFGLAFMILWGINYYTEPLEKTFPMEELSTEDLKVLAEKEIQLAEYFRSESMENSDTVFTLPSSTEKISNEINLLAQTINKKKILPFDLNEKVNRIKPSLYSPLLNYLGILGYFNPFTGEAQFNNRVPETKIPFTIAHELSHKSGVARENEANFLAYLILSHSDKPELRYPMHLKTTKSLLRTIHATDSIYFAQIIDSLSPNIKRDLAREKEHSQKYRGALNDGFSQLNNLFLRANNQKDGVKSYMKYLELVAGYRRKFPYSKETFIN